MTAVTMTAWRESSNWREMFEVKLSQSMGVCGLHMLRLHDIWLTYVAEEDLCVLCNAEEAV